MFSGGLCETASGGRHRADLQDERSARPARPDSARGGGGRPAAKYAGIAAARVLARAAVRRVLTRRPVASRRVSLAPGGAPRNGQRRRAALHRVVRPTTFRSAAAAGLKPQVPGPQVPGREG